MCAIALAASLLVASCEPIEAPILELRLPERQAGARRLSDPQLSRIRGAGGYVLRTGEDGIVRLVQSSNTRDMTLTASITSQQMDAWWGQVGAALIATGFSRP